MTQADDYAALRVKLNTGAPGLVTDAEVAVLLADRDRLADEAALRENTLETALQRHREILAERDRLNDELLHWYDDVLRPLLYLSPPPPPGTSTAVEVAVKAVADATAERDRLEERVAFLELLLHREVEDWVETDTAIRDHCRRHGVAVDGERYASSPSLVWCVGELAAKADRLAAELAELRAWKEQALAVEREWDDQAVAKLLGVPLGSSIRKGIMERVPAVLKELAELRAACEPFAAVAHVELDPLPHDECPMTAYVLDPTIGDCRRIAALLARTTEDKPILSDDVKRAILLGLRPGNSEGI